MSEQMYQVIRKPLITEKVMAAQAVKNCYVFEVHVKSTKHDIKNAIEKLFEVSVQAVNTSIVRGKVKRVGRQFGKKPNWKKAWVTLKEGEKIDLFEGV